VNTLRPGGLKVRRYLTTTLVKLMLMLRHVQPARPKHEKNNDGRALMVFVLALADPYIRSVPPSAVRGDQGRRTHISHLTFRSAGCWFHILDRPVLLLANIKHKTDMWSLRMGRFLYEFRVGADGALEGNGVRFDDDFDTPPSSRRGLWGGNDNAPAIITSKPASI
jgi:hypothetical protein